MNGGKARWSGAVAAAALLLLSACGKGGDAGTAPPSGEQKPPDSAAAQPFDPNTAAELTVYSILSGNYEGFMSSEGQYIQRKYPNFKFNFIAPGTSTTLKDVVTAKTPIDIIISTPDVQPVIDVGLNSDITDLVNKYKYDLNRFIPVTIDMMKQITGGKLLGLPSRVSSYTVYYNKDLFDKFGVPYLNDKMTWEDILETAKKLTRFDGGVQYYGFAGDIIAMLDMNERAPQYVDPKTTKATLANDYWKRVFDRTLPLYTLVPIAQPTNLTSLTSARTMFEKEKNVAIFVGVNDAGVRAANGSMDMNWDISPFPSFKSAPNEGPQPSTRYYLISSTSKNREAAFAAITQFVSDDIQRELVTTGATPPLQNVDYISQLGSGIPQLKGKNVKALVPPHYGEMNVKDQYYIASRAALINAFNQVVAGQKDVNTALRDAEDAANKQIAELKNK
ncbi:ABC transporter substrate-binding protein [Paenibacillus hodogayensis]|uniref:ABC transporter substrate-binding protein n=1 Tax=Paenibacillus hodogayensis TaxID=279208 RepID=A0ABV5W4F9_9BACL